jgi:ribosomal protein S18 acetylase RimI-like enzyme
MSSKAKERKLARKAETALANQHAATVKAANALADPLAPLSAAVLSFALDGGSNGPAAASTAAQTTRIRLVSASAAQESGGLPPALLDAAHDLCRGNMEALYQPVWGPWDEAKKRRQLADPSSRFILAYSDGEGVEEQEHGGKEAPPATAPSSKATTDSSSPEDQGFAPSAPQEQQQQNQLPAPAPAPSPPSPSSPPSRPLLAALVNYRFEVDDAGGTGRGGALAVPVAYCYEVQLQPEVQRRGLGRRLMRALEQLAACAGMHAVVLTVLDGNEAARRLYASLGYVLDPNSPDPDDYEEAHAGYRILRKDFPEAVVKAAARMAAKAAAASTAGAGAAAATWRAEAGQTK